MALVGVGLYVKGRMEAVSLYCEAFGMELGYHVIRQDGRGYYHSELNRNGEPALSVVEAEHTPGANPVQLGITFAVRAKIWNAITLCGSIPSLRINVSARYAHLRMVFSSFSASGLVSG